MQVPVPQGIEVTLDSYGRGVRFTSRDEGKMTLFAEHFARRMGMRDKGSIRVTTCAITPAPDNVEGDLGVPSAHFMILVSHEDLAFAGDREPTTTTVYRTLRFQEDRLGDLEPRYDYHFTAELK